MTMLFFKSLLERALKTFAQSLVAIIGVGATNVLDVGWMQALSVAGLARTRPATPGLVTTTKRHPMLLSGIGLEGLRPPAPTSSARGKPRPRRCGRRI